MFGCGRCHSTFDSIIKLKKHSEKDIPCDFYCNTCYEKFNTRQMYSKHNIKGCAPKQFETIKDFENFVNRNKNRVTVQQNNKIGNISNINSLTTPHVHINSNEIISTSLNINKCNK